MSEGRRGIGIVGHHRARHLKNVRVTETTQITGAIGRRGEDHLAALTWTVTYLRTDGTMELADAMTDRRGMIDLGMTVLEMIDGAIMTRTIAGTAGIVGPEAGVGRPFTTGDERIARCTAGKGKGVGVFGDIWRL